MASCAPPLRSWAPMLSRRRRRSLDGTADGRGSSERAMAPERGDSAGPETDPGNTARCPSRGKERSGGGAASPVDSGYGRWALYVWPRRQGQAGNTHGHTPGWGGSRGNENETCGVSRRVRQAGCRSPTNGGHGLEDEMQTGGGKPQGQEARSAGSFGSHGSRGGPGHRQEVNSPWRGRCGTDRARARRTDC